MHHQLHDGGWTGEQAELRWPKRRTACCQPAMRLCLGGLHPALTGATPSGVPRPATSSRAAIARSRRDHIEVKELVLQFSTAAQDWKRWAPRFVRKDAGLIRPTRTAGLFLSPFNQFGLFLSEVNSQCFFDHAENFLRPNIGLER